MRVRCGGLWTTDTGSPIVIRGKDKLAEHAVWSLKCFPDWEWYNINIFGTDDPNHFWVECDGHGKILFPGYPEGYYENHFLHSFELEDGKIKRNREFMNVFQQLRARNCWKTFMNSRLRLILPSSSSKECRKWFS